MTKNLIFSFQVYVEIQKVILFNGKSPSNIGLQAWHWSSVGPGNSLWSKSLDSAQPWVVSKQRRKNPPDKEQSIFTFDVIKIICQLWVDHMAFKWNKAPVAKSSKPVNVGF